MEVENTHDPSNENVLNSVQNIKLISPNINNDGKGLHVFFSGNYFQQDIVAIPNNVINIYCVYELDPIDFSRNNEFTIQNALFGAIEITKNADTSRYKYKGYGICFDESESFSHVRKEGNFNHTTLARNVIFLVNMQIIKETIFTLWVKIIFKKLMILQYTQKQCLIETLQTQVKNSY